MPSTTETIFQFAEVISALSLPIGGGLAAYAKWRKNAERDRRAREEAARIASERAAKDARAEEQATRNILITEYQDRIQKLHEKFADLRDENERLHAYIIRILTANRGEPLNDENS